MRTEIEGVSLANYATIIVALVSFPGPYRKFRERSWSYSNNMHN